MRFYQESPGFVTVPLPWDRLYLLVCSPADSSRGWADLAQKIKPTSDLTRVSGHSWPEIVFPAGGSTDCPQLTGPIGLGDNARRQWDLGALPLDQSAVAYPRDDPAARELAERLVALSTAGTRAVGVPSEALNFIIGWQMAGALVLPADQHFPTGCLQMATLLGRAAWLQSAAFPNDFSATDHPGENLFQAKNQALLSVALPADNLRRQDLVHPLALTRSWLITRGQWAGLELAFDGTPLLHFLGRPRQEGTLP